MDADAISRALVVWTGRGETTTPAREDARVIAAFGAEEAATLLPTVRRLEAEFYETDADQRVADLEAMGDKAASDFRERHPELSDDAIESLAWCYAFDHK